MIKASCHCGCVRLALPHMPSVLTACHCSYCRRIGGVWAYYTPFDVIIVSGAEILVPYVQDKPSIAMHHCATCGCVSHWESLNPKVDRMGINARMMDPIVMLTVPIRQLDGMPALHDLD
ncbi:GFA family protein [Acuticoccus kandeliae]|uniref:GFA family protein n=1 Tax=Acuticoccus kandeliae TaxID=2073160 RepID=UPI000D3E4951|nr:GFA family protein [Acuticoccus kandeliae]